MAERTAAVFLAEDGGRAVGTATGAAYDAAPGEAHVYVMWVAPDARGAGVGARFSTPLRDGRATADVAGWRSP